MDLVLATAAILPDLISIQHAVVISSPNAFPWTLDAPRCGRLVSRQL
jgi:hypothetical protein